MKTTLGALAVLCGLMLFAAGPTNAATSCQATSKDGKEHCSISCPQKWDDNRKWPYAQCRSYYLSTNCYCSYTQ